MSLTKVLIIVFEYFLCPSKIKNSLLTNSVRAKFQKACACLKDLTVEEFFAFRNHRVVPIFTQKIVDTISMLLKMPKIWKQQQLLYADRLLTNSLIIELNT